MMSKFRSVGSFLEIWTSMIRKTKEKYIRFERERGGIKNSSKFGYHLWMPPSTVAASKETNKIFFIFATLLLADAISHAYTQYGS